jgi:Fe2+ or Zn2+ uptake regulation protein
MIAQSDHLRDIFRAAGRRLTSQRRLILEVLRNSDKHLDAEALHDRVKAHNPDISLATIYRTLAVLKEMGLVEEHRLGEEHCHYEQVQDEPHYHFTCLGCGKVIEFDAPLVAQIKRELNEREGVQVTNAHLHLSGYCAQCQTDSLYPPNQNDEPKAGGQSSNER